MKYSKIIFIQIILLVWLKALGGATKDLKLRFWIQLSEK
jgi:hypothetical protein